MAFALPKVWSTTTPEAITAKDLNDNFSVIADQFDAATTVAKVSTIADLRALTSHPDLRAVYVLGRAAAGDGGQGPFYADLSDTTSVDNGGTTIVGTDGTRWKRPLSTTVYAPWFDTLQHAFDFAFSLSGSTTFIDGLANAGVTLDLGGKEWTLDAGISVPIGANVAIQNGTIRASAVFPQADYLINMTQAGAGFGYEGVRLRRLVLDANHKGGCAHLQHYIRVGVTECQFLHFATTGLFADDASSHELVVTDTFFTEYEFGETGTPTGIALDLNAPDGIVSGVVVSSADYGIKVRRSANQISLVHVYGCPTLGVYVPTGVVLVNFTNCYFDSVKTQFDDPFRISVVGSTFLAATSDATFDFVVLKATAAGQALEGLAITGCHFQNNVTTTVGGVVTDTSIGTFAAGSVSECNISGNDFVNVTPAYTEYEKSLFQTGATSWAFDFSDVFPFGTVQKAQGTHNCGTVIAGSITGVTNNAVTYSLASAANATVYLRATVNVS